MTTDPEIESVESRALESIAHSLHIYNNREIEAANKLAGEVMDGLWFYGITVIDVADRDALLALPDVSREELARALLDVWRSSANGPMTVVETWVDVADALLATWRVVRR